MKHKACPDCGDPLTCGANDDAQNCWCNEIPAILPPDPTKGCLCRSCLVQATAKRITAAIETNSHSEMLELARPYKDQGPLAEHLDYAMEDGNLVFSAWYHLKRGTCCGNGCRNCPYPMSDPQ